MFPEVEILLNSRLEQTVMLNDIAQDNNKFVQDRSNKAFKFHILDFSMEEAMSKFQSVVEADQKNGGPH